MILSAQSIVERCRPEYVTNFGPSLMLIVDGAALPMLDPFEARTVHPVAGTSYGLGPCTYDLRVRDAVVLAPGAFALASTLERFAMPLDVCATVMDKSSLIRGGLAVHNTHIDPGWQGWLTLELKNVWDPDQAGARTIYLDAGYPVAQVKFERLDQRTSQPYAGKYQNQPDRPVEAIAEEAV